MGFMKILFVLKSMKSKEILSLDICHGCDPSLSLRLHVGLSLGF